MHCAALHRETLPRSNPEDVRTHESSKTAWRPGQAFEMISGEGDQIARPDKYLSHAIRNAARLHGESQMQQWAIQKSSSRTEALKSMGVHTAYVVLSIAAVGRACKVMQTRSVHHLTLRARPLHATSISTAGFGRKTPFSTRQLFTTHRYRHRYRPDLHHSKQNMHAPRLMPQDTSGDKILITSRRQ